MSDDDLLYSREKMSWRSTYIGILITQPLICRFAVIVQEVRALFRDFPHPSTYPAIKICGQLAGYYAHEYPT